MAWPPQLWSHSKTSKPLLSLRRPLMPVLLISSKEVWSVQSRHSRGIVDYVVYGPHGLFWLQTPLTSVSLHCRVFNTALLLSFHGQFKLFLSKNVPKRFAVDLSQIPPVFCVLCYVCLQQILIFLFVCDQMFWTEHEREANWNSRVRLQKLRSPLKSLGKSEAGTICHSSR